MAAPQLRLTTADHVEAIVSRLFWFPEMYAAHRVILVAAIRLSRMSSNWRKIFEGALASHPHPLTQGPCSERLSYGAVRCDVTLCVDVA
jgi:hypothetical protein